MKLVADSGSTKTDWYLQTASEWSTYTTQGYNPYYFTTEEIQLSLSQDLLPQLGQYHIKELYFYGSGCANELTIALVKNALKSVFEEATIFLGDDLLAAARATAGRTAGICCILGTGSNSCYYNGEYIQDKIPSLGYILGDEGAGSYLGKMLVKAYFYRELSEDLNQAIAERFDMDKHLIISHLLDGKNPNRFLASFALFCTEYQGNEEIKSLILSCFDDFINRHILKYPNARQVPIHFIGSIAFGFQNLLVQALDKQGLSAGKILKSPFPNLLDY